MEQVTASLPKIPWSAVIPAALSLVLSLGAAYGVSKYSQGETQKSIKTLEQRQEHFVTREEMMIFMEQTREDLKDIKQNVRDIRTELRDR